MGTESMCRKAGSIRVPLRKGDNEWDAEEYIGVGCIDKEMTFSICGGR